MDSGIDHENIWYVLDLLTGRKLLISLAAWTPSTCLFLSLHARLQDLRKYWAWNRSWWISHRILCRINQFVDIGVFSPHLLMSAVSAPYSCCDFCCERLFHMPCLWRHLAIVWCEFFQQKTVDGLNQYSQCCVRRMLLEKVERCSSRVTTKRLQEISGLTVTTWCLLKHINQEAELAK